jgi:DNA helicase-2/ATP-dependent DNA helicase PcrA
MAARRLGFGSLYEAFHDNTSDAFRDGFDDGSHWSVQPFLELVIPLGVANSVDDQFKVMNLLRRFAPALQREYTRATSLPTVLKDIEDRVTVLADRFGASSSASAFDALKVLQDGKMFRLDDRLITAMAEYDQAVPPTESGDAASVQKLLHTPMTELWRYRTYIEEQSPFDTHQGVKGAEFSRVLAVLDDEEGRHNQFSNGKLFGIVPPSDKDEENRRAGKETTFERTRRLLYVCCSRAGRDLAILFFADDPAAAHAAIAGLGIFPAERVHNLAID